MQLKEFHLWNDVPAACHFCDANGTIRHVNQAATELLGYSREELLGKSVFDFIAPEKRKEIKQRYNLKLTGKIKAKKDNRVYVKKDGGKIYVAASDSLLYGDNGKISGVRTVMFDITDYKRAEEKLRRSEEKYRKLVDNANDAVVIINIDGFITFANHAFYKISGYGEQDLENLHFLKLIHPESYDIVMKILKEIPSEEYLRYNYDFKAISKSGEIKYLSFSGSLITENDRQAGVQGIIRDVTENKVLKEKIEDTQKHYERIIDTTNDAICSVDRNFKIISCNKTFARKVNLKPFNLKGKDCRKIIKNYGKNISAGFCAHSIRKKESMVKGIFENGKLLSFIEKSRNKDGKDYYCKFSAFPIFDNKGKVHQLIFVIRDITEKVEADLKIRKLSEFNKRILDNAPVSIMALDKEGIIVLVNELCKKLLGGRKEKDIVGKKITMTYNIKKNTELSEKYKKLIAEGTPFVYKNTPHTLTDSGKMTYLDITAVPYYDKNKKIEGYISMALDSTETVLAKKRLEDLNKDLEKKVMERTRQLDASNKEMSKVLEMKSKFMSDASHELRTPLTIMQGNLELAVRELKENKKETPETLKAIEKELRYMTGVLNDLALLTNTNKEKFDYEKVNLKSLLRAAAASMKILADKKKIEIKLIIGQKRFEVMGDEAKLEKLFLNLIRNAIKYTENNGLIKIYLEQAEIETRVVVEDNGVGIPEQDLPYIFERFYRVDKARNRKEGGTGLGLAICKFIAESHGGYISVESKIGQGSKFTVHLPYDFKKQKALASLFNNLEH